MTDPADTARTHYHLTCYGLRLHTGPLDILVKLFGVPDTPWVMERETDCEDEVSVPDGGLVVRTMLYQPLSFTGRMA